jgi:hypothetical protein
MILERQYCIRKIHYIKIAVYTHTKHLYRQYKETGSALCPRLLRALQLVSAIDIRIQSRQRLRPCSLIVSLYGELLAPSFYYVGKGGGGICSAHLGHDWRCMSYFTTQVETLD